MTSSSLSWESFLVLAAAAGLEVNDSHMEELYPFVEATLAGLQSLLEINVADAEPDMAFLPLPE